jgi:hypothetical protein
VGLKKNEAAAVQAWQRTLDFFDQHLCGAACPEPVSFTRASAAFREGRSTPRAFLEQCLAAVTRHEKSIQAFVTLDVRAARKASRCGHAALQVGTTAFVDRRLPDCGEGHHCDG